MMEAFVYTAKAQLKEALELLDRNGNGFLPVVDITNKLIGILTDGDVRRGFIKGETDLLKILNTKPMVALTGESRLSIVDRLKRAKRRHMPIVDENGYFLDILVLNDYSERSFDNRVVIMAGGLGKRLGELTKEIPKPMLSINGKPILQTIIESFRDQGFKYFTLCLNYKANSIKNYFQEGHDLGVEIEYTEENTRMGTAGALSLIPKESLTKPFIVTNADILTNLQYEFILDYHTKSNVLASVCVRQHMIDIPYATVTRSSVGKLLTLKEKPSIPFFINAGIYVLDPEVVNFIPHEQYFDMTSLLSAMLDKQMEVGTFAMNDYWIDIGHPDDFLRATKDF
jgi:dTDP-glucose pyrophosphorylase